MSIDEVVDRIASDIIELEKENIRLRKEVNELKNKYVWGLQPIDYALVKYGNSQTLDELEQKEYYTEEEMSNLDLRNKAIELMDSDKYQVFGWHEVIENMEFYEEIEKVLITLAKRHQQNK